MGRPLNKSHFGNADGKLAVQYFDGNSVVTGYIVSQLGSKRFVVASDDSAISNIAVLSPDLSISTNEMTIYAYPVVNGAVSNVAQHVTSISSNYVLTVEGNHYLWSNAAPTLDGYAQLQVLSLT